MALQPTYTNYPGFCLCSAGSFTLKLCEVFLNILFFDLVEEFMEKKTNECAAKSTKPSDNNDILLHKSSKPNKNLLMKVHGL